MEEGLLDCKRVVQIGLRGTGYSPDAYEWSRAQVKHSSVDTLSTYLPDHHQCLKVFMLSCMYSKSSIVCVHVGHVPSRVSVSSKWRSVGTSP